MKNIFNRLKKAVAATTEASTADAPAPAAPKKEPAFLPSTTALREAITAFIVQSLQPYVDEKGIPVAGLHFYMICADAEAEAAARVALYMDRPGMFKTAQLERKLLNHFILLDPDWYFDCHTVKEQQLPANCIRKENFALQVSRAGEQVSGHYSRALIEILAGQAGQTSYILDPQAKSKFYIGRTSTPQLSSGKIQQNDIVFLGSEDAGFAQATGSPNLHVSRNHAYIVYDSKTGHWLLYPDKGGLPDNGNKLKVHTGNDTTKWLNIYGIPHALTNGDQVELGGAAILRFSVLGEEGKKEG